MAPSPSLYNQNTLGDDDFVANFVARHDVFEALLRRLRAVEPDDSGIHHILIGPRGMGKTSLLRRLAIAINRDPELAGRYVPLSFREEQYNVLTLGNFWRNCGEALAEWAEATGRDDLAAHLDAALPSPIWKSDEDSVEQFTAEMGKLGRRPVLLVDNIDLILGALSSNDQWTLRRHLQSRGGPIMIGAATQPLKESADHNAAFYEFFQPHYLEPLDEHETETCMRSLAGRRGENGRHVLKVLDQQPERLRTLHTLTGGNPRILTLIYRLLETAESEAAMADLDILLDQVTPYYKARIEEYQTALQRAVIDAIALHWDPITTGDLSRITDIAATTLSPLLIKLRKDGLIESAETSGSYAGHQLVERFLNIWYLMRHGTRRTKQKMRWLVAFLTSFYSSSDLAEIAERAKLGGFSNNWCGEYEFAFNEALSIQDNADRPRISERNFKHSSDQNFPEVSSHRTNGAVVSAAHALAEEAFAFWETGDFISAGRTLDELITRYGDAEEPAVREEVGFALFNKAITLAQMSDSTAEIAAYDAVLARFGDAEEPALREQVAKALSNKAFRLNQMGDRAGSIAAYDATLARFGDAEEPALREQIAKALINKGITLDQMGDSAAAIAVYDTIIARFGDTEEPALRERVAKALINKGVTLGQMGDSAAEIAAYDAILARFGKADEPALREQVAKALINKGVTLGQMGGSAAEVAAYEKALAALGETRDEPTLAKVRIYLANALFDTQSEHPRAEELYLSAAAVMPLLANANLAWLYLMNDRLTDALKVRESLEEMPAYGRSLLNAALELVRDNFGSATDLLTAVFGDELDKGDMDFSDDLDRLLRLAEHRGHGERLLTWFEETNFAERVAPIYAAFQAYVRGERTLLDVNPEVRRPAQIIYDRLDKSRRNKRAAAKPKQQGKPGRGRPRKG